MWCGAAAEVKSYLMRRHGNQGSQRSQGCSLGATFTPPPHPQTVTVCYPANPPRSRNLSGDRTAFRSKLTDHVCDVCVCHIRNT